MYLRSSPSNHSNSRPTLKIIALSYKFSPLATYIPICIRQNINLSSWSSVIRYPKITVLCHFTFDIKLLSWPLPRLVVVNCSHITVIFSALHAWHKAQLPLILRLLWVLFGLAAGFLDCTFRPSHYVCVCPTFQPRISQTSILLLRWVRIIHANVVALEAEYGNVLITPYLCSIAGESGCVWVWYLQLCLCAVSITCVQSCGTR